MREATTASPEEALAELQHVMQSPTFEATDRNKRFLRYVVEEALAGRGERIKAYSIGTSVFGRGDDFDPLLDPIVRIEAGRLRRSLEHHYLTSNPSTGLRISIPKGCYVPVFGMVQANTSVPSNFDLHFNAPHLMVKPIENQCWAADWPDLGRTLTTKVISALTRFSDLLVYGHPTTATLNGFDPAHAVDIDYELTGQLTTSSNVILAEFLLQNMREGRFILSHSIERQIGPTFDPANLASVCSGIAGEVAAIIGQPGGIMDGEVRNGGGLSPAGFSASQKLIEFQEYWRKVDLVRNGPLRSDFEKVIVADPGFAAAHACLSLLYTDAARYGIDCGSELVRPIDRALTLARRAVELAPRSGRSFHALGVAKWFSGQPEAALQHLKLACSLNPNDSSFSAELGVRSAMRMHWDVGVPMLNASFERDPLQSGQYRMGLFFYHFASGEYELAYQQALLADAPSVAHPHLACAAALNRLGRHEEAAPHLEKAEAIAPGLTSRLAEDLRMRQIHPDLIDMVVASFAHVPSVSSTMERRSPSSRHR